MTSQSKDSNSLILPIAIALVNIGIFGTMFLAMGYFELVGADVSYFDEGSYNNLKIINSIIGPLGFNIDPTADLEVTTRGYAICYGLAMIAAFFAIVVANRRARTEYEETDAKK